MPKRRSSKRSRASNSDTARKALVTGSVALGAYLTGAVARWVRRTTLYRPEALPPALDAPVHEQELMEGQARFYARDGEGVPLVLLHSFNAAASSYEMKPIFDHLAATTRRPLYALDWLGFGLSDRPPVRYRPMLYQRQLRRFLSEYVNAPADVVALSLGSAYAAVVAAASSFLVRKLVLVSPTGLSSERRTSFAQRAMLGLADGAGAFELFFYRLTRRDALRRFYARQVFLEDTVVPNGLVNYAFLTTHVRGAHYAPRRFIDGTLFLGEEARNAYHHLPRPTLIVVPEHTDGLIQSFDALDEIAAHNETYIRTETLPSGLMPQWETPDALFPLLDDFLT